jgi:excinuclease ABC subunit A
VSGERKSIIIKRAAEHNLRNIDVEIPRDQLVVITGVSGSGKSSLAFDTIFAEGQRKYVESLTAYARQFLQQSSKPHIESIEGLPPTIAIQQRRGGHTPRSTVATTTEIHDYLRLLFARCGQPVCWARKGRGTCGKPIERSNSSLIIDRICRLPEGTRLLLCAPVIRGRKGFHRDAVESLQAAGFVRARVDGEVIDIREALAVGGENPLELARHVRHDIDVVVDRIVLKGDATRDRVADSVDTALATGDGVIHVVMQQEGAWTTSVYSERMSCPDHPECSLEEMQPRMFSFNSPHGACAACDGLGSQREFDPDLVIPEGSLGIGEGAIVPWTKNGRRLNTWYGRQIRRFCERTGHARTTPFTALPAADRGLLLHGAKASGVTGFKFEGVLPNLGRRYHETQSEAVQARLQTFMARSACSACGGARLRPERLHVMLASGDRSWNIADLCAASVIQADAFLADLQLSSEASSIAEPILRELRARLGFLESVGLDYLTLDRGSSTLSGGEAQRIRLATQVGSGLVGVCYVLDEPTIGLHHRDNARLIGTLRHLTDIGNTVLVVEHDEEMIRAADHLIDMGPGAGRHGGRVVAQGTVAQVCDHEDSLTGAYLSGSKSVGMVKRGRRLDPKRAIGIRGAAEHNLKKIDVDIPLGGLVCITGVSGSGKSTLINEILLKGVRRHLTGTGDAPGRHTRLTGLKRIDRVVEVSQAPIGRTPRSNPVTYTGIFDAMRTLFSKTKEARMRGWKPGRFSFNVAGGRCEACQGQGVQRIEMHFLPDVFVVCDQCNGARYNRETLEIRWRGRTIAEILDMTIEDAQGFFEAQPAIHRMLSCLSEVGLGYIQLGQKAPTLSGGEAQRVKLARELGVQQRGSGLYVLDEPTTGLHMADVEKLMHVLDRLADRGHTLVVIEHHLDVIRSADWIIDLGPEGGDGGGQVVATGTPDDIAACEHSQTGIALRSLPS